MSEMNCFGDEYVYGEVIPGYYLVQLRNLVPAPPYFVGQFEMREGSYGLTRCNDPDFVFDVPPEREYPDDDDGTEAPESYWEMIEHYEERLSGDALICYELVEACLAAGFSFEDGGFACWLSDRMRQLLDSLNHKPSRIYQHSRNMEEA